MWKIYLYNQWQYEKAEKFLCDMESSGYRLECIKCSFFFKFKHCSPQKARYFFLYHLTKDYTMQHYECEKYICASCRGGQICGRESFEPNVFRIADFNADLDPILRFRNAYLRRAFKQKMLISSLFMFPTILLSYFGYTSDPKFIILLIISIIAFFCFLYYLVGLFSLTRKSKE